MSDVVLKWYDSGTRLMRTYPVYRDSSFNRIKAKYLAGWQESNNPNHPRIVIWEAPAWPSSLASSRH